MGEAKDDGERESERWEGCQVNPEVMNEPVIKCLCSDTLSISLSQNTALSHQTGETSKNHTRHNSVALVSYDSNTHQIKSAEVFMTAMWPMNATKRMEEMKTQYE